ncbi:MAG TPA: hypothetical protein VLR88_03290 [Propionibacteriaceae bacterium]|nr:hypothetical protein [Propionibacteriaceae bacterium]
MREVTAGAGLAVIIFGGCAVFGSEDSSPNGGNSPSLDAGDESSPVQGAPDTSVQLEPLGDFSLVQGGSLKVPIKLKRGESATGPVDVSVAGLPSGVAVAALSIPSAASSGELTITALPSAKQGSVSATVRASSGPSNASVPLKFVVRGPAGSLDTTYGTAGQVSDVFGTAAASAPVEMLRLADDRIVVVGVCGSTTCAVRLAPDGNVDSTFGTAGRSTFAFTGPANSAALAPDGSIVVAFGNAEPHLFRIKPDGKLDTAFGDATLGLGVLTIPARAGAVPVGGIATVAPDGSIFVAYSDTEQFGTIGNVTVTKLSAAGSMIDSFGTNGQVVAANFGTRIAGPIGLTVRANGYLFGVVQSLSTTTSQGAGIFGFQLRQDGTADAAIGPGGKSDRYGASTKPFPGIGFVGVGVHPDGRMVTAYNVTSSALGGGVTSSSVLAIGSDAKVNTGFGTGGSAQLSGGSISDVDWAADGRVIVVRNPHLLRLTQGGAVDTTFASGMVTAAFGAKVATFNRAAIQKDGRIVVLGRWTDEATADSDLLVSRFWP